MKELEDMDWFPAELRNQQTAFIGFTVSAFGIYKSFVHDLKTNPPVFRHMFDLCSGSGEPALGIYKTSRAFTALNLSDKYPPGGFTDLQDIKYLQTKADVLELSFEPGKTYTMFNAFHHFSEKDQIRILHDIRSAGSEARFAEILQPNIFCILKVILACTAGVLLLTPFIKPFSLKRLFFTYILPLGLLSILIDGTVSVVRAGSKNHYRKLVKHIPGCSFIVAGNAIVPIYIIKTEQP